MLRLVNRYWSQPDCKHKSLTSRWVVWITAGKSHRTRLVKPSVLRHLLQLQTAPITLCLSVCQSVCLSVRPSVCLMSVNTIFSRTRCPFDETWRVLVLGSSCADNKLFLRHLVPIEFKNKEKTKFLAYSPTLCSSHMNKNYGNLRRSFMHQLKVNILARTV